MDKLDNAIKLMRERGYQVHYYTGSGELVGMNKIDDDDCIHANVWEDTVELFYFVRMMRLTSGEFSITHPEFTKYETKLIVAGNAAIRALERNGL